jgi:hypothetical protein
MCLRCSRLCAGAGDAFSLQLPRLGQLSKARLWLEGPGSPWHLNLLVVAGPDGEDGAGSLQCSCCYLVFGASDLLHVSSAKPQCAGSLNLGIESGGGGCELPRCLEVLAQQTVRHTRQVNLCLHPLMRR